GPTAPTLNEIACFTLFSASGPVSGTGISNIIGDVGSNSGLTTGFDTSTVDGTVHPIPNGITLAAANDLAIVYAYLDGITEDITLQFPAQFGHNLVLTPHAYLMNAAVTLTDTVYLDARGDSNAVFTIRTNGAFSALSNSNVQFMNGTKAENVYWLV